MFELSSKELRRITTIAQSNFDTSDEEQEFVVSELPENVESVVIGSRIVYK